MSVALGLMLAAETYFSTRFRWPMGDTDFCLRPVYKLVRFFEPSTEGEYFSTRTTLTFFSAFAHRAHTRFP
jgi:hypothetical protein